MKGYKTPMGKVSGNTYTVVRNHYLMDVNRI